MSWSVGLPGPFRIGGTFRRRPPTGDGLVITVLAYLIVAIIAVVLGLVWLLKVTAVLTWRLGRAAGRWVFGRRAAA
jgi:hypothetical protein